MQHAKGPTVCPNIALPVYEVRYKSLCRFDSFKRELHESNMNRFLPDSKHSLSPS